ncbi:MAG: hypothetical protein ABW095_10220, partial [Candidatus Thiodiazotropha sp.]
MFHTFIFQALDDDLATAKFHVEASRRAGIPSEYKTISKQCKILIQFGQVKPDRTPNNTPNTDKRVFDLMKDFGTSKSTKIDSIFDSLLVPR